MKTKKLISALLSFSIAFAGMPCIMNNSQIIQTNADMAYSDFAEQVAFIVNQERTAQGLAPVEMSAVMNQAASVRADELTELCSHTRPDGSLCFSIFDEYNIDYMDIGAENLHAGSSTPEAAMESWMNSSGHRANILAESAKYIGVGVAYSEGKYYWIQLFTDLKPEGECYIPEASAPSEPDVIKGDVNNDGSVEIADVVALASYIGDNQNNPLTSDAIIAGDVQNTGDGLTSGDILMIQQYIAGIISEL